LFQNADGPPQDVNPPTTNLNVATTGVTQRLDPLPDGRTNTKRRRANRFKWSRRLREQ
jgi:hypothetical protein